MMKFTNKPTNKVPENPEYSKESSSKIKNIVEYLGAFTAILTLLAVSVGKHPPYRAGRVPVANVRPGHFLRRRAFRRRTGNYLLLFTIY